MSANRLSERDRKLIGEKFPEKSYYDAALKRIGDGEPLAYVLGEWYFYDEVYYVSPDCLIPQPDTEHLVENAIRLIPKNGIAADLCTGSGCIAVSTAAHRPDITVCACDISEKALALAQSNAERNGVSDRVRFFRSDVLKCEWDFPVEKVDVLLSNPPYIAKNVIPTLDSEVRQEPVLALDGGEDGLDFYRAILTCYSDRVKTGGYLILEIGYDQADAIRKLAGALLERQYTLKILKDYGGNDRVALISLF